jgi:hypothetical protein
MAEEPQNVRIRAEQHDATVRMYHTQYLLANGATEILAIPADVEATPNLTELGETMIGLLLDYPGVMQVVVYNYRIMVQKQPDRIWANYAGRMGLDRIVLSLMGRVIAESLMQHRLAIAELGGENPEDLPQFELHLDVEGLPPADAPSTPGDTDVDQDRAA